MIRQAAQHILASLREDPKGAVNIISNLAKCQSYVK